MLVWKKKNKKCAPKSPKVLVRVTAIIQWIDRRLNDRQDLALQEWQNRDNKLFYCIFEDTVMGDWMVSETKSCFYAHLK